MIWLAFFIDKLFFVFDILILIRILSSWIPEMQQYKIVQFVCFYVDPYLNIFRKFIPPIGMIDVSPIVAIFFLGFLRNVIFFILGAF